MNYLAHVYLSQPTAYSVVGNLMGDFRKHIEPDLSLPRAVVKGIENHMQVDRFTDTDQQVIDLKTLFSKKRRRFAGIIIDVAFDYFLIKHWQRFSDKDPDVFISTVYGHLLKHSHLMPAEMARVTRLMARNNWFATYSTMEGIGCVLDRMSARIRFENALKGSGKEVLANYQSLEEGFIDFFPRLEAHIKNCNIER